MNQPWSRNNWSRRALLKNMVKAAGFGAGVSLISPSLFGQARAGVRGARGAAATPAPKGSSLVMLGTQGGPSVNLSRGETASAVVVDGQPYLVDCGYGTLRALVQAGIRFADIGAVFVTHLHDDHTADVAALLTHKWTGGSNNPRPTVVYGPFGSRAMVEGAIAFFKGNTEIRIVDEGRTVRPESVFSGQDLSAPKVTEVFRDSRVTVKAVENAHFPERAKEKMPYRSLAYRFDMADRSMVFSGDTAYSTGLIELARGADILVCEAMTMAARRQFEATVARGPANTESISRHVLETHTSTEEVGRMAAEAKVKTVVLYHLLPGSNAQRGPVTDDVYIGEVRKFFSGEVIVGRDQLRI
jgi:ribonuclease BN (tRNA processing enzyme)